MAWMTPFEAVRKLPGIIFKNQLAFTFDGVPLVARNLSSKKKLNLLKIGISILCRLERSFGLPPMIQIEPTSLCNLKCPLCPAGTGSMKRTRGNMSCETFKKIFEGLDDVLLSVILYGWGEPLLNRDLARMIRWCTEKGVCTLLDTNGHGLTNLDQALKVVDAGLSGMIIALDGSTQEIYQQYRKSGRVEQVIRFITLIEEAKAKRKALLPYTCLRTVVTRENEKDLGNLENLARKIGVNMFSFKTVGMQPHREVYREYEPEDRSMRRFEYDGAGRRKKPAIQCPFPFRQPTVFWDGTVVGCEYDYDLGQSWGNIHDQPFAEIWNSPRAVSLRKDIREGRLGEFCRNVCPYQDRIQDSSYLTCKELRPVS